MVILATSMAMSLPPPMAMLKSAWARAALSLMPSPTMATFRLTATDYKLDNPDDVVTTFLGHFSYQGQEYALITFLDAPHGLKSTYNFNSSGWNATELARKIVESVILR